MSQHFYSTELDGQPVTVMMGWDRPLQGFFMLIEPGPEDDEYLYSNLDDPALDEWFGLPTSLDHFIATLAGFGLQVPDRMIAEVLADAAQNVGNRVVRHDNQ
jgi:hypothetical protein